MAFLRVGLRESRKTRSRSPYPRPLTRDSYEGRYSSLSDRPSPPMSIMEGQVHHVQGKFSAPSMHSSVTSDFSGSDSHSRVSLRSRSTSVSVSEAIRHGRGRTRAASDYQGPSSNSSDDWASLQEELESLHSLTRELEETNQQLEVDKRVLEAKNTTLQDAYSELLDRVNTPSERTNTDESMDVELNHSDFLLTKYWVKRTFMQTEAATLPPGERGKGRAAQGLNVAMRYVEDEKGESVDGYLAQHIRTWARGVFVEIADRGVLRAKWGDMGVEDLKYYHREMRRKFPILMLCENSWKADQIAIDNYSSWHASYAPKYAIAKAKRESDMAGGTVTDQKCESVAEPCPEFDDGPPKEKPKLTFKIANTLISPSLSTPPSLTQPFMDPLAANSVIPAETPPITSEMTAIQLRSPDDTINGASVDAGPAIEPMPPARSTSPSAAGGAVERLPPGLPTSATVPLASITPDVVSPSPLSLAAPTVGLVDLAAVGDSHVHPTVHPTLFNDCATNELKDATNSYTATDQSQTTSNSNEPAKRVLMRPSKVINRRNECAREWRTRIKGTTPEFNEYYTSLSVDVKENWDKYAADLKARSGKNM